MATDGLEFSDIYLLVRGALVSGNGRSSISRVARRKNDLYKASNCKAKYTHEIFFTNFLIIYIMLYEIYFSRLLKDS